MVIEAVEDSMISFYNLQSGSIQHEHLDNARAKLLANMHQFSPEAHFFTNPSPAKLRVQEELATKSLFYSNNAIAVHVICQ